MELITYTLDFFEGNIMEHMVKCNCGKELLANSYDELLDIALAHEGQDHS